MRVEVASSLVRWLPAARHAAPSLPQQPSLIAPCHLQGAVETEANYKQVGPQQRGLSPSRCRAQQRSVGRLPLPRHPRGTRRTPQPPPTSAPCHPALAQVLVYALFVAAYIVALFLQASAYDTGEVVATLRGLLLPGARPRQPRAGAALLSAGIHPRLCAAAGVQQVRMQPRLLAQQVLALQSLPCAETSDGLVLQSSGGSTRTASGQQASTTTQATFSSNDQACGRGWSRERE